MFRRSTYQAEALEPRTLLATFPDVAFWDRSFGAGSLRDLMADIRDAPLGRPLPVLACDAILDG